MDVAAVMSTLVAPTEYPNASDAIWLRILKTLILWELNAVAMIWLKEDDMINLIMDERSKPTFKGLIRSTTN